MSRTKASDPWEIIKAPPCVISGGQRSFPMVHVQMLIVCAENVDHSFLALDVYGQVWFPA